MRWSRPTTILSGHRSTMRASTSGLSTADGADHDPCHTCLEQTGRGALVPHSSADLHRNSDGRGDTEHDVAVGHAAAARGVEIDDVQTGGTRGDERLGKLQRVPVDGLGRELAPEEPHTPTAAYVDGGPEMHDQGSRAGSPHMRAKRASSRRPAEADFSGWNWVPNTLPRSKATASSPP